jgi:hypothetical protein
MDERMMLLEHYAGEGLLLCQTYMVVVHFNLRVYFFFFFCPFRVNIFVWAGFHEFTWSAVLKIVLEKGRGNEIR